MHDLYRCYSVIRIAYALGFEHRNFSTCKGDKIVKIACDKQFHAQIELLFSSTKTCFLAKILYTTMPLPYWK